jgi:hypothetical protein
LKSGMNCFIWHAMDPSKFPDSLPLVIFALHGDIITWKPFCWGASGPLPQISPLAFLIIANICILFAIDLLYNLLKYLKLFRVVTRNPMKLQIIAVTESGREEERKMNGRLRYSQLTDRWRGGGAETKLSANRECLRSISLDQ